MEVEARRVVVTGGAGFIGSHIVDALMVKGCEVVVIDNLSTGSINNISHHIKSPYFKLIIEDLKCRRGKWFPAIRESDVVFHFAANPEVRLSTVDPETHFNDNVVATFNLLEAIRRFDIEELVFASSSSVYGEVKSIPVNETAPLRPVSVYGASKVACESLIHAYSELYGLRALICRYANVVGPRLKHGVVYDFVVKLIKNPNQLEILGDGTQRRSYIYIDDAVKATMVVLQHARKRFDVYNIANVDHIIVKEVADIVVSCMGQSNVKYVYKPVAHGIGWKGDVKCVVLDITKLIRIGFRPKIHSAEAIRRTAKYLFKELRRKL